MIRGVLVECCAHCGRVPLNARERARACVKCGGEFPLVHQASYRDGPDQPGVRRLVGRVFWRLAEKRRAHAGR